MASRSNPIRAEEIRAQVALALAEDIGKRDLTASLIPEQAHSEARVISRERAVICGQEWFNEVFAQLDEAIRIDWRVRDADSVEPNQLLCTLSGPSRALLSGERTALNFLQTLSGTATLASSYADAVVGTGVKVLDTRKTIPGLRLAQKYAVTCGGCHNHRIGLYDGVLIKENHIAAAGSIAAAVEKVRDTAPSDIPVEIEVEDLAQVEQALAAGADILLLDNMSPELLLQAVTINKGRAELEASGGITLQNIRNIAETGVNYISVGEITKQLHAIDLSMRFKI
ncbi:MAG: carboxylating nicotinate-nucleotide diphosphorylase [Pseudomonadota bacterium]